jgi:hypothetical protein
MAAQVVRWLESELGGRIEPQGGFKAFYNNLIGEPVEQREHLEW